jgi:carbon starvation protein
MGHVHPKLGRTDWLPGAVFATGVVTAGWGVLVQTGSIDTIWPMFGIANQLLAVIALCLVTTLLVNGGRGRYAWVTLPPMLFVTATTMTAAVKMIPQFLNLVESGRWSLLKGVLNIGLMVFVIACVLALLIYAVSRWVAVWAGMVPLRAPQKEAHAPAPAKGDGTAIKGGEHGIET